MKLTIKVPGSCGELVQGMFNGAPCLITCPINLFSTVTITDEFTGFHGIGWKSKLMIRQMLKQFKCDNFNFGIELKSDLPRGKGMASSSADIAAVAKAIALALNIDITAEIIAKASTNIEPTDGIFYDGIVAMNPLTGKILGRLAPLPKYQIAIFDFGGKVDTLKIKRRSNFCLSEIPKTLKLDIMIKSALANQQIIYKPQLDEIISFSKSIGALGINAAHTGTVIGIFFDESVKLPEVVNRTNMIIERFKHIKLLNITNLIDGGFYINGE